MSLLLNTNKYVDNYFANVNQTLTYTVTITNSGSFNAYNLILTDLIPQGANFIDNSIYLNGINIPGIDPSLGLYIGTIPIGNITTVTMSALIVTLPYTTSLSNVAQLDYEYIDLSTTPSTISMSIDTTAAVTTVQSAIITLTKSLSETILTGPGQILNYTLNISNSGNITAMDLVIIDTIPTGTTFVPDSVKVLGTTILGAVIAPPTGLAFGEMPAGYYSDISFQVQITSIPASNSIINQGLANYNYYVNGITPLTISSSILSNVVILSDTLAYADLSTSTKFVDKGFATLNTTLTYTIIIPNTGTVTATNVLLYDTIPNGTTYINNSLFINSISTTFTIPLNIGIIPSGATKTVTFQVKIN